MCYTKTSSAYTEDVYNIHPIFTYSAIVIPIERAAPSTIF